MLRPELCRVPTAQGKQGKWPTKIPVRENTGNLEMLSKHKEFSQNTGNFVSSSCKYSDSKSKGYLQQKKSIFSRSWIGLPSQFCVCNSHKLCNLAQGKFAVGQEKHREFENTI